MIVLNFLNMGIREKGLIEIEKQWRLSRGYVIMKMLF